MAALADVRIYVEHFEEEAKGQPLRGSQSWNCLQARSCRNSDILLGGG